MGQLESLKKEIDAYCSKNDLILYEVDADNLTAGTTIEYISGDYKDFLKIAETLGVKLIYYEKAFGETKEDEIAEIYLGFAYNGVLHTLGTQASWYEKELEESYKDDEEDKEGDSGLVHMTGGKSNTKEGITYIKNTSEDEIRKDFLDFIRKEYPEIYNGGALVYNIYRPFLESKGVYNQYQMETRLQMKTEKVKDSVEAEVTKERFEKEKGIIPDLVKECVEWAKGLGLNRTNMQNLNVFLGEKKINLTNLGFDVLHTQVNKELKH